MRSLIVEDEITSRILLESFLEEYGNCDTARNFVEAIDAFRAALSANNPYDLICLDIRLPGMDGHKILKAIRQIEKDEMIDYLDAATVLMTTALSDLENKLRAYYGLCDGYITKPVTKEKLEQHLRNLTFLTAGARN